jgi:hypothetical protein
MNTDTKLHPANEAAMQRQVECAKRDKEVVDALFAENRRMEEALKRIKRLSIEWNANKMGGLSIQRRRWEKLGDIASEALSTTAPTPPVTAGG